METPINLLKKIEEIDRLRSLATQGRWEDKNRGTVFPTDKPKDDYLIFETYPQSPETEEEERRAINNAEYIVALHNNLQALRRAALDGERYRKAGEALVEVVIGTTGVSVTEDFSRRAEKLYTAIEAYRQAVEQKEV